MKANVLDQPRESHAAPAATYSLDPLCDPRWDRLVENHPRASIFHTRQWLEALKRTYGYKPVVHTTNTASEELTNGVVLCRIDSRLTGSRLVSLPFSDHCEPLVEGTDQWEQLVGAAVEAVRRQHLKYVEFRTSTNIAENTAQVSRDRSYYLDVVDIGAEPAELFAQFSRKGVQQPVRRAERENLLCEQGNSPELLQSFYRLLIRTRRRHRVPPQPMRWFENLIEILGDKITLRVASKEGVPIASIITLTFRDKLYYKYGCSDERFNHLGGIHCLLWHSILAAKQKGAAVLDMGRSDIDQAGLLNFKQRWNSTRTTLTYYRYPSPTARRAGHPWAQRMVASVIARMPDSCFATIGSFLYPHIG